MIKNRRKTEVLLGAGLVAFFSLPCFASAQTVSKAYSLSPDHANSKAAFILKTLSNRFSCAAVFYKQRVNVDDSKKVIDLSFQDSAAGLGPCVGGPVGPAFNIPALKDGSYEVYVSLDGNCPGAIVCPPPISVPELAGILTVSSRAGISPVLISANESDTRVQLIFSGNGMDLSLPNSGNENWNPARVNILGPGFNVKVQHLDGKLPKELVCAHEKRVSAFGSRGT